MKRSSELSNAEKRFGVTGGMCGEGKPKSNSGSTRVSELGLCSDKELTLETSATQTLHGD